MDVKILTKSKCACLLFSMICSCCTFIAIFTCQIHQLKAVMFTVVIIQLEDIFCSLSLVKYQTLLRYTKNTRVTVCAAICVTHDVKTICPMRPAIVFGLFLGSGKFTSLVTSVIVNNVVNHKIVKSTTTMNIL